MTYKNKKYNKLFVDVNGDGKQDLVRYFEPGGPESGKIFITYAREEGKFPRSADLDFAANSLQGVADMDQDGVPEFLGIDLNRVGVISFFFLKIHYTFSGHQDMGTLKVYKIDSPYKPLKDTLTRISNGMDSIDIAYSLSQVAPEIYSPLTNNNAIDALLSDPTPEIRIQKSVFRRSDSLTKTIDYSFGTKKFLLHKNPEWSRPLGFDSMQKTLTQEFQGKTSRYKFEKTFKTISKDDTPSYSDILTAEVSGKNRTLSFYRNPVMESIYI